MAEKRESAIVRAIREAEFARVEALETAPAPPTGALADFSSRQVHAVRCSLVWAARRGAKDRAALLAEVRSKSLTPEELTAIASALLDEQGILD